MCGKGDLSAWVCHLDLVCGAIAKPEKFPKGKDVGISASVTTISCLGKAVTRFTMDGAVAVVYTVVAT